jgi:hypothetical protein
MMKGFLQQLSIFLLIASLLLFALGRKVYKIVESGNYLGAIAEKHQALAATNGPRLIFAGGSNLAFGLNSKRLSDSLGLPIFNLGLHGGLGHEFMIREAEAVMRPGDVLVFSMEYFLSEKGGKTKYLLLADFPEAVNYFSFDLYDYLRNVVHVNFLQVLILLKLQPYMNDPVYKRKNFNAEGDLIGHLNRTSSKKFIPSTLAYRYWEGIPAINALAQRAGGKGVKVLYLFPGFQKTAFENNRSAIRRTEADIRKDLNFPILNDSESAVYADSLFFDSEYHLSGKGREIRTADLIQRLRVRSEIPE